MENQTRLIYTEVYNILNLLGKEYINKLPKSLYEIIEKNSIENRKIKYKSLDEINKNNVSKASISMIALFHINYWCENQEEKDSLNLIFKNNYINNENEKRKKYNPDNIFTKKSIKINNTEETNLPVTIKKESFFRKIINFFFKKH